MALQLDSRCPVFIGVVDARDEKIYKAIEIDDPLDCRKYEL